MQAGDDRHDPGDLLVHRDLGHARDPRLAADVDDRRALVHEVEGPPDPGVGGGVVAAVGERVGRGVDDAHEHRLGQVDLAAAHDERGGRGGHPVRVATGGDGAVRGGRSGGPSATAGSVASGGSSANARTSGGTPGRRSVAGFS